MIIEVIWSVGALLGIILAILKIHEHYRNKPNIKLEIINQKRINRPKNNYANVFITVNIDNVGNKATSIKNAFLKIKDIFYSFKDLYLKPFDIEANKTVMKEFKFEVDKIIEGIVHYSLILEDTRGKKFKMDDIFGKHE